MPWFKRDGEDDGDPTEAFARDLFAVHEHWEDRIESSAHSAPTRTVLLGSAAGATVAFGAHGAMLREKAAEGGLAGTVERFARALDNRRAVEAAYRVVTWALVSEYVASLWPEDHEREVGQCEIAFGFENLYEETAVAYGQPAPPGAGEDEQYDRTYDLVKATLYAMVSAALNEPVVPEDGSVNQHLDQWVDQFEAGVDVGAERLRDV